jgi:signal transduction histidine kinase
MAAVVAHEVRNPLAGIAGAVQIIGRRLPDDSPEREIMDGILSRIDALNAKIEDLLSYSRPRAPRFQRLEPSELVHELLGFLSTDPALAGVETIADLEDDAVEADASLLRELLANVILNAAQALAGRGRITIRGRTRGDDYRIQVIDDGPGMPKEVRSRVLEPFYSTRHSGTGLGLAIADQIAVAHGGRLKIASSPRRGTKVTLTLPRRHATPSR